MLKSTKENQSISFHNTIAWRNQTRFIWLDTIRCESCWSCVEVCPNNVIGKIILPFGLHKHAHIDYAEQCTGCKKCVRECPVEAVTYTYCLSNHKETQSCNK